MRDLDSHPVGLILLRIWTEDGNERGFRAHVTVVDDLESETGSESYESDPAEVIAIIRGAIARITDP